MSNTRSKHRSTFLVAIAVTAIALTKFEGVAPISFAQRISEATLASVRRADAGTIDSQGNVAKLASSEHMRRAAVYMINRAFPEARRHWQAVIGYYSGDPRVPEAMLGIGRSYFQAKDYEQAYTVFDELARKHSSIKEGREGLNYSAATLLRMSRFDEAADRYAEYISRFPTGERIETAHLNVVDTLREGNRPHEALNWIAKTKTRFAGTATETNAIFAELRLHVAESNWTAAVSAADQLTRRSFNRLLLTSPGEVAYLRAFSLEQAGNKQQAIGAYASIPDGPESYYGWLATKRLKKLGDASKEILAQREAKVNSSIAAIARSYPAPYRGSLIRAAKNRNIDPRFLLAIMKQESVFKPQAKSPAGARGLLQLTIDTAQKYGRGVGIPRVQEHHLYQPDTSIALGAEYIEQLKVMFHQQLEPVAASYNGGEDNVARWLARAKHKDPGVFTAEVGFEETKGYVQKVMANYRVYTQLYTQDLVRR